VPLSLALVDGSDGRGAGRTAIGFSLLAPFRCDVTRLISQALMPRRLQCFPPATFAVHDMKIYLAGPLFTVAEREFNQRLAEGLTNKQYEVFLPQSVEQDTTSADEIFKRDRKEIDDAKVVLANMDGSDPDSGTCWECGYAYGRGKPIIVFRTDSRVAAGSKGPYNLMLTQSADIEIHLPSAKAKMEDLILKILDALKELTSA
jgi:nucleoside 2-deoxyribosyltransferase